MTVKRRLFMYGSIAFSFLLLVILFWFAETWALSDPWQSKYVVYWTDPELGFFRPFPDQDLYDYTGSYPSRVSLDQYGFRRTVSYRRRRENGKVFRVLILGDSYAYGYAIGNEFTFPQYLQRMLDEQADKTNADMDVDVWNSASSGQTILQQMKVYRWFMERGKWQWNYVILCFCHNDIADVGNAEEIDRMGIHSRVFARMFVGSAFLRSVLKTRFTVDGISQARDIERLRRLSRQPNLEEKYRARFQELVELTASRKEKLITVCFPRFDSRETCLIIEKMSHELGVEYVPLERIGMHYLDLDLHFSQVGNYEAAKKISRKIIIAR